MSKTKTDNFSLTAEQYLAKFHVLTYLEDAICQLLEHKEDNSKVSPEKFLHDYFTSVIQGNHTLFRDYGYLIATPHNRGSFIRNFWKCFHHIAKNGDLLSAKEYHSLICLLCPDFPFEPVQKTSRIVLMDDAMDCLMSFSDFLYAFQIQFHYEDYVRKVQEVYQAISNGTYRPGQVVVVPTHSSSRSQVKQQGSTQDQLPSSDGIDAKVFLDVVSQIGHSCQNANPVIPSPPIDVVREILQNVSRVSFYGFLMALAKHDGLNDRIGILPDKTVINEDTDQEINSGATPRPKSARPKTPSTKQQTTKTS